MEGATKCRKCRSFLHTTNENQQQAIVGDENASGETDKDNTATDTTTPCCALCFGLWEASFSKRLQAALENACEPYGGLANNQFSRMENTAPTVSVAGDVMLRYHSMKDNNKESQPFTDFLQQLKQHVHQETESILFPEQQHEQAQIIANNYPECVKKEEQGYLSVHVLLTPPRNIARPINVKIETKKQRKRFRGPMEFSTQGGDPRKNLEERLEVEGYDLWHMSAAETVLSSSKILEWNTADTTTTTDNSVLSAPMEIHVAVFRRPMYLYGYYTKSRRDISQTPFHVLQMVDGKRVQEKLGLSSVEEEICGPMQKTLPISTVNNHPTHANVFYGMCKFHASGREDMDVRMLLNATTKGRPFCLQVVDSLHGPPSDKQLQDMVQAVNHSQVAKATPEATNYYGENPNGVGISPELKLCNASAFGGLQADTESKIKYYGCYCWSEKELPAEQDDLTALFGTYPVTIHQKTPLRVLHRRTNAVRIRQVLSLNAERIDDHHFRLVMGTQAGTYVKEFVHGDLRRTKPSISSILGCKTDLLQLDCEGIQLGNDDSITKTGSSSELVGGGVEKIAG
jgi:tRNA U54 and U55 pseudouridine synthase Pus10